MKVSFLKLWWEEKCRLKSLPIQYINVKTGIDGIIFYVSLWMDRWWCVKQKKNQIQKRTETNVKHKLIMKRLTVQTRGQWSELYILLLNKIAGNLLYLWICLVVGIVKVPLWNELQIKLLEACKICRTLIIRKGCE